jgi:hypothetical protein
MNSTRRLGYVGALVGLSAISAGCGGSEPPARSPTETTSAELTPTKEQHLMEDLARLERERDDASRQLADQVARNDEQSKRLAVESDTKRERADLTRTASTTIESARAELMVLDNKAARAPQKSRAKMQKAVADAKEKLDAVEAGARSIGADYGAGWTSFRSNLEAAVAELQQAVRVARDMQ